MKHKFKMLGLSLGAAAFAIMAFAKGDSATNNGSLFPATNCPVYERMEMSRDYLEEKHSFVKIQGIFPWPDVDGKININGIWLAESRGAYAVLQQVEHAKAPKYGALVIRFYNACNHQLLAEGERVLDKKDWDSPSISIPLKNRKLNGKNLRAYIKVFASPQNSGYDYLEISVREARVGTRDFFYLDRFE